MKKIVVALFVFVSASCFAQPIVKYFDYAWKETGFNNASFMAEIEKTDSGYNRQDYFLPSKNLQMQGLYKDSACKIKNGHFTYYYVNEKISKKGKYINDEMQGQWLYYHKNGILKDSSVYEKNKHIGMSKGWYENGVVSDSVLYEQDSLKKIFFWFDNGTAFSKGNKLGEKKIGTWQYYHRNGKTAAVENYNLDTLKSREYFDENGILLKDTTNKDADAAFKGGLAKWAKFIIKNIKTPSGYDTKLKNIITVVVAFTIDEEGNVINPFVEIPYIKIFDNAAMDLMKKSPKWLPAIDHNRRIKALFRQPISYALD